MFRGFSMGSPCSELDFPKRPWRHFSWGQSWLDSNPEADAEEIKEKHKEIEGAVLKLKKSWGWLVVWNHGILWLSILIGNVIIPTDEVIFFRGDETTHQFYNMGMDQYLLIPFLGEWTSIYQLFWCSPGVQGFDTLPYIKIMGARIPVVFLAVPAVRRLGPGICAPIVSKYYGGGGGAAGGGDDDEEEAHDEL